MARRPASKARTKTKAAPARTQAAGRGKAKKPGRDDRTVQQRLAALERERDTLRTELAEAEERLRALEKNHAHVSDRIAWALDSLHTILKGKG
jgi:flagellar motility protein MotE (MotC chaperone)